MISICMYNKPINAVHVEVTDRCNSECPACARSAMGGPVKSFIKNKELGIKHFTDFIGKKFCSQIKHWNFCGNLGDPSNAQELVEIVEFLFTCNPDTKIDIRTNGGARNGKFWEKLGEQFKNKTFEKNGGVIWSIDGLEDTNHIYRKNVRWSNLWKNFQSYFSVMEENPAGSKGAWEFLLFDHNKHQISEIKKICESFNLEFRCKEAFGFSKNIETNETYTMPVYDRIPDENNLYKKLYSIKPFDIDDTKLNDNHKPHIDENYKYVRGGPYDLELIEKYLVDNNLDIDINCASVSETENFYEIFLNADGAVYPCCFHASKMQIGDGQLKSMYNIYNNYLNKVNTMEVILSSSLFTEVLSDGISGNLNNSKNKKSFCMTCVDSCAVDKNISKQLSTLKI